MVKGQSGGDGLSLWIFNQPLRKSFYTKNFYNCVSVALWKSL